MHSRETISAELKRIQDSVPQIFRDGIIVEKLATPEMKFVAEKALESDTIPEEKKEHIRLLMKEGYFDKKKFVENKKIAKQRDLWVEREIKKSVKEGRLPTKKQLETLKELDKTSE